ncbi:M20 family metallopeptidase (plasmid) [Sagittula stellata E-37]|uniref:Aminobenzoyl-glutamate utilization protein n=2 Tax=Sagittula stellata TaxID=52603 RepID=A3K818_SAGS3|nr:M20 family metallopeptidase [Sagittula stellata]EBA06790.1 aminobenzoyl-glutamate utilization protein [Sagittula stellata E-37]
MTRDTPDLALRNDMLSTAAVSALADRKAPTFIDLSDRLWGMPELRWEEVRSVEEHIAAAEAEGFAITRNLAGMPTAFMAECGEGDITIGFLGEYDALAGLSQEAGLTEQKPLEQGGKGHGCHHNLLGSASLLAAVTLRDALAEAGVKARVRYFGCPAEEGGSGKTYMAREGSFDGLDAAFCWHPAPYNAVMSAATLANKQAYFRFTGRSSHAAVSPEVGRSALDALELMNIGINFMREHMSSNCRVHYSITDTGGTSPNVVQGYAEGLYLVRAPRLDQAEDLYARVLRIAEGAALMSDTTFEVVFDRATSGILPNRALEEAMHEAFEEIGAPAFDETDHDYADRLAAAALTDSDRRASAEAFGAELEYPRNLHEGILALPTEPGLFFGSTDVGDVSNVVPVAQCLTATTVIGTPFHTWQTVTQGKMPHAHKAMVTAAKVMASTAARVVRDPDLRSAAQAEFDKRRGGKAYRSPMPDDKMPPKNSRSS